MVDGSYILKDNLMVALTIAIEQKARQEKMMGFKSESALLSGWRENLKHLLDYGGLIVKR